MARPAAVSCDTAGDHADRARSSAVEHYVDIVGVTGSNPVAPTMAFRGRFRRPAGARVSRAHARRDQEKADEGQEFAPLAQAASSRLSRRASQGPGVRDQQDAASFQGPAGLRGRAQPHVRTAGSSSGGPLLSWSPRHPYSDPVRRVSFCRLSHLIGIRLGGTEGMRPPEGGCMPGPQAPRAAPRPTRRDPL